MSSGGVDATEFKVFMVAGLCERCKHVQVVDSAKGSRFFLCMYAKIDPRYAKYPRLPVMACRAYEEKREDEPDITLEDGTIPKPKLD